MGIPLTTKSGGMWTFLGGSQASEGETIIHNSKKPWVMTLLVVAVSWLAGPRAPSKFPANM